MVATFLHIDEVVAFTDSREVLQYYILDRFHLTPEEREAVISWSLPEELRHRIFMVESISKEIYSREFLEGREMVRLLMSLRRCDSEELVNLYRSYHKSLTQDVVALHCPFGEVENLFLTLGFNGFKVFRLDDFVVRVVDRGDNVVGFYNINVADEQIYCCGEELCNVVKRFLPFLYNDTGGSPGGSGDNAHRRPKIRRR
jgi:hypothetical protein